MIKYEDIRAVHIEVSSYCNSACPSCPRNIDGGMTSPWFKPHSLSIDEVKKIMPVEFVQQLKTINFCGNYGDPMMAKDILLIFEYLFTNNPKLSIVVHTNGGMRQPEFWEKVGSLFKSKKASEILFSFDGLEDTNHLYRIGVDWKKAIANAQAYISSGGKAVWDFLVFKHNEHQIEEARQLAIRMGFVGFIEAVPHGFHYNGYMRVVNEEGKLLRLLEPRSTTQLGDQIERRYNVKENHDWPTHFGVSKYETIIRNSRSKETQEYFSKFDSTLEIKNCTATAQKEIYIDSNGSIHPCCWIGHINQETLPTDELRLHKDWVENFIGMDNINGLNKTIREIVDLYFNLIENSWSKTYAEGRNPMCIIKCGIERPNRLIRPPDISSSNRFANPQNKE